MRREQISHLKMDLITEWQLLILRFDSRDKVVARSFIMHAVLHLQYKAILVRV